MRRNDHLKMFEKKMQKKFFEDPDCDNNKSKFNFSKKTNMNESKIKSDSKIKSPTSLNERNKSMVKSSNG
jgi:hypothetical protein